MKQDWDKFSEILNQAAIRLNAHPDDLRVWSWPETFASTAGPHGGIGGQAFTDFQVFAFESEKDCHRTKCCDGVWKYWDGKDKTW